MIFMESEVDRIAHELALRLRNIDIDYSEPAIRDHYIEVTRFVLAQATPHAIVTFGEA